MSETGESADWNVRIAQTRGERERIFRFRFDNHLSEVGRWPIAAQASTRTLREVEDEIAVLFFAETDGKVVGSVRLRIGPIPHDLRMDLAAGRFTGFQLHELALVDHVAVAKAFRRAGLLEALVRAAADHCRYNSVQFLFSHTREDFALRLKAMGFCAHALMFNHPELGPRVPLVWPIGGEAAQLWFATTFPEAEPSDSAEKLAGGE
jgi:GNAT superfamily N-acetyltransferase